MLGGEPDAAEHLLAVPGRGQRGLPRGGLGEHEAQIVGFGRGRHQRRLSTLDRDQRFSQPMPDRLERRDGPPELCAVQGVLTGQRQHRATGAHQPPAERLPSGSERSRVALGDRVYRQVVAEHRARLAGPGPHHPGVAGISQRHRAAALAAGRT